MFDITASIVLFENDIEVLQRAIDSFLQTGLKVKLYLIDNSNTERLRFLSKFERIEYIKNEYNLGFGKAHNIAIRKSISISKYHIVLNPDVYFDPGTLEKLYDYMNKSEDVGLLMPKVLYPNGDIQYLCKLLPSPINLFIRRFLPFGQNLNFKYELKFFDYNQIAEIPNLSGCFMFLRREALSYSEGFDERFFMYLEDIDLTRRVYSKYKTIYYPYASIYHVHEKESFKSFKLLKIHVSSAIKYFNKYGWLFDSERRKINSKVEKMVTK